MNEFLATLLQAVLIAAVPVFALFIGKALKALAAYLGTKSDNDLAKKYLDEAAEAISTAVTFTSQKFVDALKKSGAFTKENQQQAFDIAMAEAKRLLTEDAKEFLVSAYGTLDFYLEGCIEAEVRRQKVEQPVYAELVAEPDTVSIAANAAAAAVASMARTAAMTDPITRDNTRVI